MLTIYQTHLRPLITFQGWSKQDICALCQGTRAKMGMLTLQVAQPGKNKMVKGSTSTVGFDNPSESKKFDYNNNYKGKKSHN